METYFGDVWVVRLLLQRGIAAIYLIAFLGAFTQFPALLGERGLLPVPDYLSRIRFLDAPSLFHLHYSDRFLRTATALGIALSLCALSGLSEAGPIWLSAAVWLLLWALYLSIVNVGQTFYGFGWESMLCEAGFFAAFLGPTGVSPSLIPVLALRWMLFRVELGAGLIKLRHDRCWRDLTCLYYHHETQPMPNPLSAYFHALPRWSHRASVAFSHFVQIAVPFALFAPQPFSSIAGCLVILHQLVLIVSGNYAWLNWLTVILAFTCFSDATLPFADGPPALAPRSAVFDAVLYALAGATALLSIQPTLNLFSKDQKMNYSWNSLHLVGAYGAFGSVTRRRYEVMVEGTEDEAISETTEWREYAFKGKPGDVRRRPRQWAPHHLRLDWLMWFLPLSVGVIEDRRQLSILGHERWFVRFVEKLLEADPAALALLRGDPFDGERPRFVRASFYRYRFADRRERRARGAWWERTYVGEYLPPRSLVQRR